MARDVLARHNVVATYPRLEEARAALGALERAGYDADDISVLGPQIDEAAASPDTRERDAAVTARVGKTAGTGTAIGTVAGGVAGFVAGAVAFGIPGVGPAVGAGVWAATLGGAVAGGSVGGVAGGVAGAHLHEDWELTYQSVRDGKVL